MDLKELADGVEFIAEFTEEETKTLAQAFEEYKGHPLAHAWNKIIKVKIKGYYFQMAHIPVKEPARVQLIIDFSGKITGLEGLLVAPADFIKAADELKEEVEGAKDE